MSEVRYFQHDAEYREHLRKPFDPAQVGKLPRVTDKTSAETWCETCKQKLKRHIHIDFVGHANVTDRLNHEAPDWAYTIDRIETVDGHILGVLGTMTIGGKSIHEAGAVARQSDWGEELKLAVSDFIVRGAMRFGVGLDMWIKGDAATYENVGPPADEAEEAVTDEPVPPASAPTVEKSNGPPAAAEIDAFWAGKAVTVTVDRSDADVLTENAAKLARAGEQHQRVVTLYGGQKKSLEAAWAMFGISAKDLPVISMLSTEQAEQMIRAKGGL